MFKALLHDVAIKKALLQDIAMKNGARVYQFSTPNYKVVFDGNQVVKEVFVKGSPDNELKDLLNQSLKSVQDSLMDSIEAVIKHDYK
jgi:hypothetical protein